MSHRVDQGGCRMVGLPDGMPADGHACLDVRRPACGCRHDQHAARRACHAEDARLYAEQELAGVRMLTCIDRIA